MLSICIPIYNKEVAPLVETLLRQAREVDYACEVVCLDDASEDQYRTKNRTLRGSVRYEEMERNIGRAAIRNRFLEYATGEYLLFLDCDAEISDDAFVRRYVDEIEKGRAVVCGGHRYVGEEDAQHCLKYRYGTCCEVKSAEERMRDTNRSFMTGNFMIAREVLKENPFDERLTRYGHEDTLMGFRLSQRQYSVWHIDNPIDLRDIDTNEAFLEKTRESIRNLAAIYGWVDCPEDFAEQVRLLSCYKWLKKRHLAGAVKGSFSVVGKSVERSLLRGRGPLWCFNFYKIGLLCRELV